ncbi:MAG TPA: class I SAM-dependent methyltransferase [Gemmatimonadota bacterium]|nr:class I SAM-dependent methyltransferase [Gemmatimonadota bacterium]
MSEPLIARFYFGSRRLITALTGLVARTIRVLNMVFTGVWLGILSREQLHSIGERYYRGERGYRTDDYNRTGLFDWERRAVEQHFAGRKRLLVMAVGGGREVLALRKLGFDVDGFESDPDLVRFANGFLEKEGLAADIRWTPWDHGPDTDRTYDGVIVGWGAYMLIRGRDRRVRFLRELRDRVAPGAPLLLSFYTTRKDTRYFRGIAWIGRRVARILGRDPVQVGDCLAPNYTHFFTRERLEAEMTEGGFEPLAFDHLEYGHGVGRAV